MITHEPSNIDFAPHYSVGRLAGFRRPPLIMRIVTSVLYFLLCIVEGCRDDRKWIMGAIGLALISIALFVAAFEYGWIDPIYEFFFR